MSYSVSHGHGMLQYLGMVVERVKLGVMGGMSACYCPPVLLPLTFCPTNLSQLPTTFCLSPKEDFKRDLGCDSMRMMIKMWMRRWWWEHNGSSPILGGILGAVSEASGRAFLLCFKPDRQWSLIVIYGYMWMMMVVVMMFWMMIQWFCFLAHGTSTGQNCFKRHSHLIFVTTITTAGCVKKFSQV